MGRSLTQNQLDRLKALCSGAMTPSAEAWREICESLDNAPEGGVSGEFLEELSALLDSQWPDDLRATMCGMRWDEQMVRGEVDPRFQIVRTLKYNYIFVGRFTGIMIRSPRPSPGALGRSGAPSTWDYLSQINFGGQNLNAADLAAFGEAELPRLVTLDLGSVEGSGVGAMCQGPWVPRLEELSMEMSEDAAEGARALAEADFERLKTLRLSSSQVGASGIAALADSNTLPALHTLHFSSVGLDESFARGLSGGFEQLKELYLYKCEVDAAWLKTLLSGRFKPQILTSTENPIGDEGVRHLAELGASLTSLSISKGSLTDAALHHLAGSAALAGLETLSLTNGFGDKGANSFTGAGLCALLDSPHLGALRDLSVHGSFERVHGRRLADLESLTLKGAGAGVDYKDLGLALGTKLRVLSLGKASMSPIDARNLLGHIPMKVLEQLNLSGNTLDDTSLARMPQTERLSALWLSECGLTADDLGPLLESSSRPERLHLDNNPIGDEGAERLATSPLLSGIKYLGLANTGITDRGAIALASSPYLKQVDRVFLGKNKIGDAGAEALAARVVRGGGWMNVDTRDNPYGDVGKAALEKAPPRCCP